MEVRSKVFGMGTPLIGFIRLSRHSNIGHNQIASACLKGANSGSRPYSIISSSIFLRRSFGQPGSPQSFFQSRKVFGPPPMAHLVFEIGNT